MAKYFPMLQLLAIAVLFSASSGTWANPAPRIGQPHVEPEPVRPGIGYRRTIQLLKDAQVANEATNFAAPRLRLRVGARRILVVMVKFRGSRDPAEYTQGHAAEQLSRTLFGDPAKPQPQPTMTQYYADVSCQRWLVSGDVIGPLELPGTENDYLDAADASGPKFKRFVQDALSAADRVGIDWERYDNDAIGSGENDGVVDTVLIVQPEVGGEVEAGHMRSRTSKCTDILGRQFVTASTRHNRAGHALPEHIRVEDFSVVPALDLSAPAFVQRVPAGIGVFCHEYAHVLGLPDLYGRTARVNMGAGEWCLMAAGEYGANEANPNRPVELSAWCKRYLGWAVETNPPLGTPATIAPVEISNQIYRMDVPNTGGQEYFLFEYRCKECPELASLGRVNWDAELPASGIAIWHVDEGVGYANNEIWPFAGHGAGQNDIPSDFRQDAHSLVALIQQDGLMGLESRTDYVGSATNLFRADSVFMDDPSLKRGSRSYQKLPTGIMLKEIKPDVRLCTFDAQVPASPAIARNEVTPDQVQPDWPSLAAVRLRGALREAGASLRKGEALTESEKETLVSLSPREIESVEPNDAARELKVARALSTTVPAAATRPADSGLCSILSRSKIEPVLSIEPNTKSVTQIANMRIPSTQPTVAEDARSLLQGELQATIGNRVVAAKSPPTTAPSGSERFIFFPEAVVAGVPLPVWDRKISVYYDKSNNLTDVVLPRRIAPEELRLINSAAPNTLNEQDACAMVARLLRLERQKNRKVTCKGQGLFLVNDNPANARICYKLDVSVGFGLEDEHVILDPKAKEIISIE